MAEFLPWLVRASVDLPKKGIGLHPRTCQFYGSCRPVIARDVDLKIARPTGCHMGRCDDQVRRQENASATFPFVMSAGTAHLGSISMARARTAQFPIPCVVLRRSFVAVATS